MKHLSLLILIILLCPSLVEAHPGKTDRYGGHKCIKDCEEWGLYYAEYHLHDKDGRPIHIAKKKKPAETPVEIQSEATETMAATPPITSNTRTITVYRTITTVHEENIFVSNPLLWVLLALLLLLLILRRSRKDPDDLNKA